MSANSVMRPYLKWLAAAALAAWGLSALAGHLPPRVRLLLLFPLGFGLLAGWSAGVIADEFRVRRTRRTAAIALLFTVAGLANTAWTAYRQSAAAARKVSEADSQQLLALRFLEDAMENDPVLQQRYREELARLQPTFSDYLAGRLRQLGWIAAPWPTIIWGTEVLLGGVAAAFMFHRRSSAGLVATAIDNPSPTDSARVHDVD